jgi:hypothetical protein
METIGNIEIRIVGSRGNLELKPETYDIKEIAVILEQVEQLLFPDEKKSRPLISYNIQEGSVRHIFRTGLQVIIGFNAIIGQINTTNNIDFLELNTQKAIEKIQEIAVHKDYAFEISTSLEQSNRLKIDSSTKFEKTEYLWAVAEFYFYGKISNAGGKNKANIHLSTEEFGSVIIATPIDFLADAEENILYKTFGIRAKGRQNIKTGEIDRSGLVFVELVEYNKKYDEDYLQSLRSKAKNWLSDISPDDWLHEIRGYNA